jgi:hypothetical protein
VTVGTKAVSAYMSRCLVDRDHGRSMGSPARRGTGRASRKVERGEAPRRDVGNGPEREVGVPGIAALKATGFPNGSESTPLGKENSFL